MEKIQVDLSWNETLKSIKKKNKFIFFIIFFILLIILYSIYSSLFHKSIDRNSYVQLVDWSATLNNVPLYINSREALSSDDLIETTTQDALAIIEWWDGSLTRLWWNTSLRIDNLYVSNNKDKLEIAFELFSWKTWSNIVSYIPEESYFKETYKDTEASVRWTVFNLDAENNYLYVLDHNVSLTNSDWETVSVWENSPITLDNFSLISLTEFITWIKDSTFEKLNRNLDDNFIIDLTSDIENKLEWLVELSDEYLVWLSDIKKEELYKKLLSGYQDLNFVWLEEGEDLFELKLNIKESLLLLSPDSEKEWLIKSYLYDLEDTISSKDYGALNEILYTLDEYKDYMNTDIVNNINWYLNKINLKDWIDESILNNLNIFKNTFTNLWDFSWLKNSLIDKASEIKDWIKWNITNGVSNLLNK